MHALIAKARVILETVPSIAMKVLRDTENGQEDSGLLSSRASTPTAVRRVAMLRDTALISHTQLMRTLRRGAGSCEYALISEMVVSV